MDKLIYTEETLANLTPTEPVTHEQFEKAKKRFYELDLIWSALHIAVKDEMEGYGNRERLAALKLAISRVREGMDIQFEVMKRFYG